MLAVAGVLDAPAVSAIREQLDSNAAVVDGGHTAHGMARRAKRNEQLAPSRTATGIAKLVEERLRAHPVIAAYARPSAFARIQVNRYTEGMQYGWHVDDAHIAGIRTDLSFTCFLSAPDDYDGGELVVTESAGERRIKLPAGDCFVYPADTVHRVDTVTRGERWAVVGWIRSQVRDAAQRELLYECDQLVAAMSAPDSDRDALMLALVRIRGRLQRMWSED